jgi:hypothetical protein
LERAVLERIVLADGIAAAVLVARILARLALRQLSKKNTPGALRGQPTQFPHCGCMKLMTAESHASPMRDRINQSSYLKQDYVL